MLLLLPAYNEALNIPGVIRECQAVFPDATLLVVDDGSRDETAAAARAAGAMVLDLPCNLGVGPAVQAGLQWALEHGYDCVVRLDADGQHDPADIPALLKCQRETGADFVTGSRFLPGATFSGSSRFRRFGNRCLAQLLSLICNTRITDPTSGLWCVRGRLLSYFAAAYPSEYPEPEAIALLRRQGYTLAECPVHVRPRAFGVSSIRPLAVPYFALRVGLTLIADRMRPVDPRHAANATCAPPLQPL